MFNQLACRHDLAKSSFYDSTTPVTGVDYLQRAITSDRRFPAFSQFSPIDMPVIQSSAHIRRLSAKCIYHLRQLRVVRRTLTDDAAKTLVHAFITSRIDYCNSVFSRASSKHVRPLQSVLHAAARLITRRRKFDSITPIIRDSLH